MSTIRSCAVAIAWLTLSVSAVPVWAQVATVNDLKAPSTPAASILGTSPTSVERPDSPRALVFNLASTVSDSGGVPQNYAMQVAPYWLVSHPDLRFAEYIKPTIGRSLRQSFAVSLASADWTTGTGKDATDLGSRLAVGLSAVVVPGRLDAAFQTRTEALQQQDEHLGDLLRTRDDDPRLVDLKATRDRLRKQLSTEQDTQKLITAYLALTDTESTIARITADIDAGISKLQASILDATKQLQQMEVTRYGPQLAIASAWSFDIPHDVFGDAKPERAGIWVTPSYRAKWRHNKSSAATQPAADDSPDSDADTDSTEGTALNALGVLRYLHSRVDGTNAWDLGGRLVLEPSRTIAVSGEVVKRWKSTGFDGTDSVRAVAMIESKLSDKAYLFASFGRDFTDQEKGSLISTVGLNIGFGQKPSIASGTDK